MLNSIHINRAVVTVTTESYLEGTKVLFHSFLKHNPEYGADLVVIHDQLSTKNQAELKKLFPVKFHQISEELKTKLNLLSNELQYPAKNLPRFWSLESMNLNHYKQILFLDSDLLVRGNVMELFNQKAMLSACGDRSIYQNQGRDGESFLLKEKRQLNDRDFEKVFNAGVFSLNLSNEVVFQDAIELIEPNRIRKLKSGHTDQFILNHYFKNKVNWLPQKFNFILRNSKIKHREETQINSALIWHYTRHPKPWKIIELLKKTVKGKASLQPYREWHLSYCELLKKNFRFRDLKSFILSKLIFR